jgi:hypothetical protein
MIYKYNMTFDVWEEIPLHTNGFPLIKSLDSSVFRINKTSLLFVSGESQDENNLYYIYDLEREKFI